MKRRLPQFALLVFPLLPLLPLPPLPPDPAVVTYRRVFKGSSPEFIEIKVPESGNASYDIRQLDDDPDARPFVVGAALRAKIFEMAAQLNHFQGIQLDVKKRIANLGQKTLRWERGAEAHETSFNYTLHPVASQLMQLFEGLARQQEHYATLERRIKFDRLGVNQELLEFEIDINKKILPEPQRLLPLLEQVANDSRFVEIARQRARAIAERLRGLP